MSAVWERLFKLNPLTLFACHPNNTGSNFLLQLSCLHETTEHFVPLGIFCQSGIPTGISDGSQAVTPESARDICFVSGHGCTNRVLYNKKAHLVVHTLDGNIQLNVAQVGNVQAVAHSDVQETRDIFQVTPVC